MNKIVIAVAGGLSTFLIGAIVKQATKYDKNGFDKEGFDREGFNEKGYNREKILIKMAITKKVLIV